MSHSLPFVWAASVAVLAFCTLASFRLGFAQDVDTLLVANGARVLFGAAVGSLLAFSGALRVGAGRVPPLRELEWFALSSGAAGGGFFLVNAWSGAPALLAFALGALLGASLAYGLVRALDRPRRWTNLAAAALLAVLIGVAALAATYVRAERDVAPLVSWLLGDLAGASVASGLALLALAVGLLASASRAASEPVGAGRERLELLALGLGVGAAGPLAFVGTMVPRAVRGIGRGASEHALLAASMLSGAATVVAIDTVPRLLVGGYDFPFNVAAGMLAIPIFLGWNRWRLRQEVGTRGMAFELAELAILVVLTAAGTGLAVTLGRVIYALT